MIEILLTEDLVYWPASAKDGFGDETYSTPYRLKGRIEDKVQVVRDAEAEEVTSMAVAYIEDVVEVNGWLWRGDFEDLTASEKADPKTVEDARRIIRYGSSSSVDGLLTIRKAYLT